MVVKRNDETIRATFVDSLLFPYNFSFGSTILSEVSACRFVSDSRVALVGDSGEVFYASIRTNGKLDITMKSRVPIVIPGFNQSVDAEGVEVFADYKDSLLISSEAPMALTWFDRSTGISQNDTDFPSYNVPEFVLERTKPNKGLEALTNFSSMRLDESSTAPTTYLMTTTEKALDGDTTGFHRFWIWDASMGGDPLVEIGHWASRWKEPGSRNEFLAISDMDYWDDQELLLVLERGYDGSTNMIRLWGVDLVFPLTRNRILLFNWTLDTLQLSDRDVTLQVDNYEAICMFPAGDNKDKRKLLVINDDNHNPNQIGTQFVVLQLEASALSMTLQDPTESLCDKNDECSSTSLSSAAIVILLMVFGVVAVLIAAAFQKLRRSPILLYREQLDSDVLNDNDLELI